jgi:hypothetical protein
MFFMAIICDFFFLLKIHKQVLFFYLWKMLARYHNMFAHTVAFMNQHPPPPKNLLLIFTLYSYSALIGLF